MTDCDAVPNYLDSDDDGDGVLTIYEGASTVGVPISSENDTLICCIKMGFPIICRQWLRDGDGVHTTYVWRSYRQMEKIH
jgi:hypothetical protein